MTQTQVNTVGAEISDEFLIVQEQKKNLGKRIKEARERIGITQDEMAIRIEKGRSAIAQWESGKATPGLYDMTKLASCLKVTPAWIAFGSKESTLTNVVLPLVDVETATEFKPRLNFEIPRLFLKAIGRPLKADLIAVAVPHDGDLPGYGKGDILLVDKDDRELVGEGAVYMFVDGGRPFFVEVHKIEGNDAEVTVKIGGHSGTMGKASAPVAGRVVAALSAVTS